MKCPQCQSELTQVNNAWNCPQHGSVVTDSSPGVASAHLNQHNVFISYGRDDAMAFATRLAADIKTEGHTVFIDLDGIEKGGFWEVRIEAGIRGASVLAAVMTPHSLRESSVCRDEIVFAINEGKSVVPLKASPGKEVRPSLLLARRNWIDFSVNYEDGLNALLRFLRGDESGLHPPAMPSVTGLSPIDVAPEIARLIADFTGRKWVTEEIDRWMTKDSRRTMILVAEPGVGKSAMAAWLSQSRKDVVGIHLCTHANTRTLDPHEFVANLVSQLHARLPGYAERVEEKNPLVRRPAAADDFRELIVQVTRALPVPDHPYLIIVDSLDEALSQEGETVLDVIIQQASDLPAWLRILATTRPEEPILNRVRQLNVYELMAERSENRTDVREYIEHRLGSATVESRLKDKRDAIARQLESLSQGNFLYARTALDALEDGSMTIDDLHQLAPGMMVFFLECFRRRFPAQDVFEDKYAPLLRVLVAARGPLPFQILHAVAGCEMEAARRRLHKLRSYLRVFGRGESATYAIYHRSMKDWLTDPDAAGDYWCRIEGGDAALAAIGWKVYQEGSLLGDEYYLRYLPDHLLGAKEWSRLTTLLTDLSLLDTIYSQHRNHEWMRLWRQLLEKQSPASAYRKAIAASKSQGIDEEAIAIASERISWLLRDLGLISDAVEFAQDAVTIREKSTGNLSEDGRLAGSLRNLAESLRFQKDFDRARSCYERALSIWKRHGEQTPEVATIYHDFAEFYRDQGNHADAIESNKRAFAIREKLVPLDIAALADCVNDTGTLLWESGDRRDSPQYYDKALELFLRAYPDGEHHDIAAVLNNIAMVHEYRGDLDQALVLYTKAKNMACIFRAFHAPQCRRVRRHLISCLESLKRFDEAAAVQREELKAAEVLNETGGVDRLNQRERVAELLDKAGRVDDARAIRIEVFREIVRKIDEGGGDTQVPGWLTLEYFRELALSCYQANDYHITEDILRLLLRYEFDPPSTHCHIARVLLLMDREEEARNAIASAWNARISAKPYVMLRILFFQLMFSLLDNTDNREIIGSMKSLMGQPDAHVQWTIGPVIEHMNTRLDARSIRLLNALAAACSDGSSKAELDSFSEWNIIPA
jgi:tetratricopeptide (TPR) repeat protein